MAFGDGFSLEGIQRDTNTVLLVVRTGIYIYLDFSVHRIRDF